MIASTLTPWIDQTHAMTFEQLPHLVVETVCGRILDSIGCALGAWDSKPAHIARTLAKTLQPATQAEGSCLWGTSVTTTPDMAAFANGILVRYLDFNDTYLSKEPAHPSDNIPALLAVAESCGASGKQVITAIALAYQAQCRLCDAASIRAKGWDHVNYGSFSVALGASYLLGLNAEQTHHALSLSMTGHAALRQTRVGELSHWKGCAFANSARNAVFATRLAQLGMTGPREVVEGEMGFMAQLSGPFVWPTLRPAADADWMILKTYIKHFPAEYHSQSAIEAALTLREKISDLTQVASIQLETFDAGAEIIAGFPEHWAPKSRETADHSMPYCVTVALLKGAINLESFAADQRNDEPILSLLKTVTVARSPELSAQYPEGIPNRVTVILKDGSSLTEEVTYPLGHAGNPMSRAQIEAKFDQLAANRLSDRQQTELKRAIWSLPEHATVHSLNFQVNQPVAAAKPDKR